MYVENEIRKSTRALTDRTTYIYNVSRRTCTTQHLKGYNTKSIQARGMNYKYHIVRIMSLENRNGRRTVSDFAKRMQNIVYE